jgi:hypothetical protein
MTRAKHNLKRITLATVVGLGCFFVNEEFCFTKPDSLMTAAQARIGRPLTPLSYAGVARRTTRRAVAVGAAATSCVQVVDAYGRIVTRCY